MFGGDFEVDAFSKEDAINELEIRFPGARRCVKDVRVLH